VNSHPLVTVEVARRELEEALERLERGGGSPDLATEALATAGLLVRAGVPLDPHRIALSDRKLIELAARDLLSREGLERKLAGPIDRLLSLDSASGDPRDEERLASAAEEFLCARDAIERARGLVLELGGSRFVTALADTAPWLARREDPVRRDPASLFRALPLIREVRARIPEDRLDRLRYWWWYEPLEEWDQLGAISIGSTGEECRGGLPDRETAIANVVAGTASADEALAVSRHAESCPACREALEGARELVAEADALAPVLGPWAPAEPVAAAAAPSSAASPLAHARAHFPVIETIARGLRAVVVLQALGEETLGVRLLDRSGEAFRELDGGSIEASHALTGASAAGPIVGNRGEVLLRAREFPTLGEVALVLVSPGGRRHRVGSPASP
jgi:hypothetical protein